VRFLGDEKVYKAVNPKTAGKRKINTLINNVISESLENYFEQLGETEPSDLYKLVINQAEKPLLISVMRYTSGNQSKAAAILGLSRATLRKKLAKHKID
tara:strand:+ start:874 stop:1170 length:297 start_codon:yes stop_codon:yes gene_type:complete